MAGFGFANTGEIAGCSQLQIDNQILTADPTDLLLNGVPIATINVLPNIEEWAEYDAIHDIVMNGAGISGQPFGITGSKFYGFSNSSALTCSGTSPNATLFLDGVAIAGDGYTGVSEWANYPAISAVDGNGQNFTNLNNLNFNTAVPLPIVGNASINNLNSLNFSYVTAGVGQAGLANVNNIAWWNPNFPGVPGAYVNQFSKVLGGNVYLCSDTALSVPSVSVNGLLGDPGAKISANGNSVTGEYVLVNGNPCPASWSEFPCTAVSLNMNDNQITRCRQIDFANTGAGPFNLLSINGAGNLTTNGGELLPLVQWSTKPATEGVDLAGNDLNRTALIRFGPASDNILAVDGANRLTYNGNIIQTGTGNIANWAQYNANHNVVIPAAYALTINAENTLTVYKNTILNTNIYHGAEGNASSPDFISFPTSFQVGNPAFPARVISMTAGAEGFGINSDTEVNIDALGLVAISAGGVLTMEAVGDVNITGALTTFEIGDWTVAAGGLEWATGGVVWGAGAFDLTCAGTALITAPLVNIAGASVSFTGGLVTIASGGLAVAAGGVSVAGGGVSIAGGGLIVGGGAANLNGGATVSGTLNAATITGVTSLAGAESGAALTNIASINGYNVNEIIFAPETYIAGYSAVVIPTTPRHLASMGTFTWNFNSPRTIVNVTVNGTATAGAPNVMGFSLDLIWSGGSTTLVACGTDRPAVAQIVSFAGNNVYTCSFTDELRVQPPFGASVSVYVTGQASSGTVTQSGTAVVTLSPSQ